MKKPKRFYALLLQLCITTDNTRSQPRRNSLNVEQKYLGNVGTLVVLALISAFPPLSTDLYLPALPHMIETLHTSQSQVNLTLSAFFIFFAGGLLFWGPLSEKYGRKPVLTIGLFIYIAASILCAYAPNVGRLIGWRILQAFGGSAATAVATAMVKDMYDGREREQVMAILMSMVVVAPIVAPVIGAVVLKYTSWRAVFLILGGFGIVAMLAASLLQETLEKRYTGTILSSLGRLAVVLKNPGFTSLLAIFAIVPMAIMSFLAASSYIYINRFGLSEQEFSYFLAFNAMAGMTGPMLYMRISRYFKRQHIISCCFAMLVLFGLSVSTIGHLSPYLFALSVAPATIAITCMRVPGVNLMLEQQERDTGSASALINFFAMVMGSVGMVLVSINPSDFIATLGIIQVAIGFIGGCLWFFIRNSAYVQRINLQEN